MDNVSFLEVRQCLNYLFSKLEKYFRRGWPILVVEISQASWHIFHENPCLIFDPVMLQVCDYIRMVKFFQNFNFVQPLFLFLLAGKNNLFDCRYNPGLNINSLPYTGIAFSYNLAYLPLLKPLIDITKASLHQHIALKFDSAGYFLKYTAHPFQLILITDIFLEEQTLGTRIAGSCCGADTDLIEAACSFVFWLVLWLVHSIIL